MQIETAIVTACNLNIHILSFLQIDNQQNSVQLQINLYPNWWQNCQKTFVTENLALSDNFANHALGNEHVFREGADPLGESTE